MHVCSAWHATGFQPPNARSQLALFETMLAILPRHWVNDTSKYFFSYQKSMQMQKVNSLSIPLRQYVNSQSSRPTFTSKTIDPMVSKSPTPTQYKSLLSAEKAASHHAFAPHLAPSNLYLARELSAVTAASGEPFLATGATPRRYADRQSRIVT